MWDKIRFSAVGSFSLRRIALLTVAVLMPALLLATVISPTTFAADASWSGDSITYGNDTYKKQDLTLPGTDENSQTYVSSSQATTCPKPAKVIVIPGDADTTKEIANAQEIDYTVDCNNNYTDPSQPKILSISAKQGDGSGGGDAENKSKTTCAVTGVGWIICSVSRWIADGMDHVFDMLAGFLTVKPLSTDTSSGLYQAWAIVRGLANACFIVAFLVIIYSQITSYGISNYEIKKMIPKLIIAAILVNISYYICALAVDVSNILGDSIAKALMEIRNSLPAPMPGGSVLNWKSMTQFLLSAGTIGGAGLAGYAAFTGAAVGGSMTALVFMLFPILVTGLLSVLIALIVLAARQALITVLIIISPLAFVAFLLPNTEKQFERWRGLFTTMLMVFPLFSLLYGGSQLASFIIIQNTDQISVILLAMFIQVAPLALTPFLVRFSGSMLGKFAGMMNKPKSALVGRTRDFANDRAKVQAAKAMKAAAQGNGTYFQRRAFRRNLDQKDRDSWGKQGEAYTEAAWHNDSRYRRHHHGMGTAELIQKAGESTATRQFERHKAHDQRMQQLIGRQRENEDAAKMLQAREEARWEEARTGRLNPQDNPNEAFAQYAAAANEIYREQKIADSNATIAKALQSRDYATELGKDTNVELQVRAGGRVDKLGKTKVKSSALSEVIRAGQENVEAIKTASPIKAGDIKGMRDEFDKAVAENDVDSLRAYADMLGNAKDPGIRTLREVLNNHHETIKNSDMHETFMHFLSNNSTINTSAKDIGDYSRDVDNGYRKLQQISESVKTWRNMDASQFSSQKSSSQIEALKARDDDGNWAISRQTALELYKSPMAWANIKTEIKPLIKARAQGVLGLKPNGQLFPYPDRDEITDPREQHISDDLLPQELKTPPTSP